MPEGAVYVGRPGPWGNPFTITAAEGYYREVEQPDNGDGPRELAVRWFREWLRGEDADPGLAKRRAYILNRIGILRGKDLACFCPIGEACHADVLIELANGGLTPNPVRSDG